MEVGPPESACRRDFKQPYAASFGNGAVVNVYGKGAVKRVMCELERRTRVNPSRGIVNLKTSSKPGAGFSSGISIAGICLLAMRWSVYRGRESSFGFDMELGNSPCNAKRKLYKYDL
jgi:hypothetical protein